MHIGLNLVFLVPGETGGMEVYARELIPELAVARPEWRFTAFVSREAAAAGGPWNTATEFVTVPVNARRRAEWVRGEQVLLPRLARRAGVDLVHSLASTAPVWGRFARVATVHDLIYLRYPEAHGGLRAIGMRALVPLGARRSDRVITGSEHAKGDLVRAIGLDATSIDVVPHGVRAPDPAAAAPPRRLREQLGLGTRPVVLAVGAKRPHKNLPRLLDALARLPRDGRPILVVTGYATENEPALRAQIGALGLGDDVRLLGWVPAAELDGLYALAAAFVLPSLYEGFGLPVLEAMIRGVPVACSNAASLPEVASDAALLFDPERPDEIAAAMEALITDRALAARLVEAGRTRARAFTWARCASGTLAAYERALAPQRRA